MNYKNFMEKGKKIPMAEIHLGHIQRWVLMRLEEEALPFHVLHAEYTKHFSKGCINTLRKLEQKGYIGLFDIEGMMYVARLDKLQQ